MEICLSKLDFLYSNELDSLAGGEILPAIVASYESLVLSGGTVISQEQRIV